MTRLLFTSATVSKVGPTSDVIAASLGSPLASLRTRPRRDRVAGDPLAGGAATFNGGFEDGYGGNFLEIRVDRSPKRPAPYDRMLAMRVCLYLTPQVARAASAPAGSSLMR
jgi:hypothetical protein